MKKQASFRRALATIACGLLIVPGVAAQSTPEASSLQQYATTDGARLLSFSPDGSMVAGLNEDSELCAYAVPSGDAIACTDTRSQDIAVDQDSVAWAPDSSSFLFATPAFAYLIDSDIFRFDAETGAITNLTDDGYDGVMPILDDNAADTLVNVDVAPAWSPDGTKIAFSRTVIDPDAEDTPSEVWILDLETGDATKLATFDETEPGVVWSRLLWSPDSATIYASVRHADSTNPQNGVHAIDVATGDTSQLAGANDEFDNDSPMVNGISPDGSTLVVSYPAYLSAMSTGMESAYGLLSTDGGTVEAVVPPADVTGDLPAAAMTPAFTPDGSTLVYTVRRVTTPPGLVIARDLDTGDERVLTELPDGVMPLSLSPGYALAVSSDGTAFVMISPNDAYLVPVSTSGTSETRRGHFEIELPAPDDAD